MTGKHTPGPWRVHSYNNGHLLGYIQGAPIARQKYGDAIVLKMARPTSDRAKSDARLIAAAPDLLEACEAADRMFSEPRKYNANTVRAAIRAAIARATGEA